MGGLLEDIQKNKKNLSSSSEAILTAHTSFITNYKDFLSLVEKFEEKVRDLELREGAVKQLQNEVLKEKEDLQLREKKCVEIEQRLERREKGVAQKEQKWLETEKRMQTNSYKAAKVINFNVSGIRFTATKEKLLQHKGSLFEQMIMSDHPPRTSTGEIFIERDPTYFPLIMRFVVSGTLPNVNLDNLNECVLIQQEFHYFQLPVRFPILLLPKGKIKGELISDKSFGDAICEWLPRKHFQLLYKSSVDGQTVEDFHKWCDGKGPTLVLFRSKNNYLFGGYSPISWAERHSVTHPDMFTFTLFNPHNIPPTKFSSNGRVTEMSYSSRMGPFCNLDLMLLQIVFLFSQHIT